MRHHYPRLRSYFEHGSALASDAIVICFYMQHHCEQIAGAVMRALELFQERIRPHSLTWCLDHDGYIYEVHQERWSGIRERMFHPPPDEAVCLDLMGISQDVSGIHVAYPGMRLPLPWPEREHATNGLFFRLPTEYLEERGADHIRTLALDMAEELPFNSGYVDLCLCDEIVARDEELRRLVRKRYPGIHVAGARAVVDLGTWVDGVHWMNFLGQPVLGQLGGPAALRQLLEPHGIAIHEMTNDRVLLTLSEWPEVGDVEAGESLPKHRALARLLEPYLYLSEVAPFQQPQHLDWKRRFLD